MKHLRSALLLLLCAALLLSLSAPAFAEEEMRPFDLQVLVEDGAEYTVRAYEDAYEGNLYLNLGDLALALRGTSKQYAIRYTYNDTDGSSFVIVSGKAASLPAEDAESDRVPGRRAPSYLALRRNRLFVDDTERKYYSYREDRELYLSLTDIQLMLDLSAEITEDGNVRLYPERPFAADPAVLREQEYFESFGAVLLGDADSGELLFSCNPARAVPIASLSKLMSFVLIMEALEAGEIGRDDYVPISQRAAQLSKSADGIVELSVSKPVPLSELLQAMLLASSNESCLALAEYVSGSEAAFVERMNERAEELALSTAVFYTCHGLPVFRGGSVPAKLQNRMSGADLFRLCAYILETYPQITAITSAQYAYFPTLDYTTANSNPLVFNLPGVTGLKTGNTNKAGFCVAASLPLTVEGETHNIVALVLGAETADVRGQAAEILLRWAQSSLT